jgi:peroxiredoxin
MLRVGQTAPDFALPGAAAGRFDTHGLTEYTDRGWTVVLVFYPFDFHPACTDQWCSFRDAEWLTVLEDVVVLGVSTDGVYSHGEYSLRHDIGFTLLSDTDGRVARAYGVLDESFEGHRNVPRRATFAVDPDRVVQFAWAAEGPDDQPDMESLRRATACRGDECALEGPDGPASAP